MLSPLSSCTHILLFSNCYVSFFVNCKVILKSNLCTLVTPQINVCTSVFVPYFSKWPFHYSQDTHMCARTHTHMYTYTCICVCFISCKIIVSYQRYQSISKLYSSSLRSLVQPEDGFITSCWNIWLNWVCSKFCCFWWVLNGVSDIQCNGLNHFNVQYHIKQLTYLYFKRWPTFIAFIDVLATETINVYNRSSRSAAVFSGWSSGPVGVVVNAQPTGL
jgi:hypothetical protein